MFTGIVEAIGRVAAIDEKSSTLRIEAAFTAELSAGDSVSVDGVCLTVQAKDVESFSVSLHEGTKQKTTFRSLQALQRVNLERALRADSRLDGHIVQGHVDGLGKVLSFAKHGPDRVLTIALPAELHRLCIREGSIAVNGISLTIAEIDRASVTINIIPQTYRATALADIEAGGLVNVECDILGRYMERLTTSYTRPARRIAGDRSPQSERAFDAIEALRRGEMIIVVDDASRENEGDFFKAAERVNGADVNFMARHGRGLICLTLEKERAEQLDLAPMASKNSALHGTAFTESIDLVYGTTTGISTEERARTIRRAAEPDAKPEDFARPGHVFPIVADSLGLSGRRGHTEAAVMLARETGNVATGVICEILNEDGSMARWDDLLVLAASFSMALVTVGDLIAYEAQKKESV